MLTYAGYPKRKQKRMVGAELLLSRKISDMLPADDDAGHETKTEKERCGCLFVHDLTLHYS